MKTTIVLIVLLLSTCFLPANSQNISDKLLKDLVKMVNGKMTVTDFTLLTSGGKSIQIKAYGEAPAQGVISRDNFIAFFTALCTEMIAGMKTDPNDKTMDLEDIIGKPDIEINVYMAKSGIQIETITGAGPNRVTMQWSDILK